MSNPTLYINKINDSILFDEKNKEFTICDGSLGTYKFCDVVRSQIVYEHARYKGKSPLFSHRVLISTFNTSIFIELKKVYVGIEIELSNIGKVYVYISKNPVIQHNLQFEEDYKIAKQIDKKLKRMALEKKTDWINILKAVKIDLFLFFCFCVFVLTQWFVKRTMICIELLQDYYLQMCSENTPLRLTNGVLGVFFIC